MNTTILTMKDILLEKLPAEGIIETGIKGVGLFRRDNPYKKRPQLYNPQIILLVQGKKNIYLGDKTFVYDPQHYYVQTVPLPVECEAVIEEGKPMLGMVIMIDPQTIGEILFEMDTEIPPATRKMRNSLYNASMSDAITDAALRLLKTLDSKNETRVLGPIFLKEILFKIISGENGEILRELAINNRGFYQISRVISKIHENYSRPIEIQALAREAGMSSTAFHASFKAMTSTSPLQYIKNIRLHKAKEIIQNEGEKANAAAMRVGYESSSQFSREYKRTFGTTPAKDRQTGSVY
ncbi:hypothetical protein B4O97_09430 [Marispirochaeta aestuarii]|uniref:HTH araC/xylS-type domain-containing protein n=1 Tax=Marispirochaeta aestuarii TaxID=1963862 RepID=A0A1Y1RZM8_9SPIO|nr:AraC family transcriptional regulator [Marispirochaeta aestuarii]ORC35383.1 hypothetical protein B4O97_09430 [Marispirochaeta aestuarii]